MFVIPAIATGMDKIPLTVSKISRRAASLMQMCIPAQRRFSSFHFLILSINVARCCCCFLERGICSTDLYAS